MKTHYILNIIKTVVLAIVGLLISTVLGDELPLFMDSAFLTGILFAGLPFGWMTLRKVFGGFITIGLFSFLLRFILMCAGSLLIGWAVMLYELGTNIFGLFLVNKEIAEFKSMS